jgi:hypothetical protein
MSKRRRVSGTSGSSAVVVKDAPIRFDNNNILTALPHELLAINVLRDFLTLEELAVLDTALSNKSLRAYFAQVYACIVLDRHVVLKLDATVKWLRSRGVRGKHFELWHGITKSNLTGFCKSGALWESLNLTGYDYITDVMLTKLSGGSPHLKHLNLSYCADLTDVGIRALSVNCRQLEHVVLWGCYELTNSAVESLAANCPRIQHLNVRCCRKITDSGLQAIAGGFSCMRTLNFTYCRTITDAGVWHLAKAFPMLTRISFAYCVLITDAAVRYLSQRCPQLEALDLTNCDVSNEALVHIANSPMSKHLRELHVSTCRNVTDYGLQQIGEKCPNLVSLHIAGCDQITLAGLRCLPATCIVHNPA